MNTIIKNIRLIDFSNGEIKRAHIIFNSMGIIEEILMDYPDNSERELNVIDGKGNYILPGLINAHAHLFGSGKSLEVTGSPNILNVIYRLADTHFGRKIILNRMKKNAQIELMSGVTIIRSVGEFFYQDVRLRDKIDSNKVIGPTLLVSGYFLSVTDGHGAPYLALESDSPWEARRNVRKNVKQGIDWIKICVTGGVTDARRIGEAGALQFTEEEISAICDEAHKNGTMVAAHVESTEGVRIALKGGVDTVEHGARMDDEIIDLFKANPKSLRGYTSLIPTFIVAAPSVYLNEKETTIDFITNENGKYVYQEMLVGFKQAIKNNIKVGIGNDASMSFVSHYDFWRELDHIVKYGNVKTLDVLKLTTKENAKILGIDDKYGSIEVGKMADFIMMKNNPIDDITALKDIDMVIKHGELVEIKKVKRIKHVDSLLDKI
ncbi:amidohydrolase family protein [Vagococcus sp. PNs007]|uniref:Amidohydrolase family protein n=1 Tax=Vagococcus proximus TaxID=2991417 RepID=A0ABT5X2S6_9ENTE|nr:amidohydrolase family protein [Vagococcus proximus]MDF0480280.1 amidohydrolase family protein [Vagococcus proximus]